MPAVSSTPQIFREFLNPSWHSALLTHVEALAHRPMRHRVSDTSCGRDNFHNDPLLRLFLTRFTPFVSEVTLERLKPSYVFTSLYRKGGWLPDHIDRPQCHVTLDYCVSCDGEWPINIGDSNIILNTNDAVVFHGRRLRHGRPEGEHGEFCWMVLFHYVPATFTGPLT